MNKEEIESYARKNWVPILRNKSADFLCQLVASEKPKNILEIGTCVGYSGMRMLENSQNSFLTTIEKDAGKLKQATQNFCEAGFENRVKLILGDAGEEIKKLQQKGLRFDFIFLDGPKGQYLTYLPTLKDLLKKDGLLVADDVFYHGWVKGDDYPKHKHRTIIIRLRMFLEKISNDPDFETTILDLEDGISISRKLSQ